jgi:hypothetical protein
MRRQFFLLLVIPEGYRKLFTFPADAIPLFVCWREKRERGKYGKNTV